MKKITTTDPESKTADIVAGNLEHLKTIFPEAFTEGKVDFEVLKQLLGDAVEEREEKYGLNWHGKRRARQLALTPSTGTLRPCPEDSVDWDKTQNLMIEGDNLEVLKLLQKSYATKVKLIYIDPPYNTGKDFVYPDDFQDSIKNYHKLTGQVDGEGRKISSNTESSGRFHTDWLNMMYPRLKLARNLLRDDGLIMISIDDNEYGNLKKLCEDVFGENNIVESLVWKRRATPPNDRVIGCNHEYIIVCAKSNECLALNLQPRTKEDKEAYINPDGDAHGPYRISDLSGSNKGGRGTESCVFPIKDKTGKEHWPPQNKRWLYNKEKIADFVAQGRIGFRNGSGTPFLKRYLNEVRDGTTLPTILTEVGTSQDSAAEIRDMFGEDIFDFPKPLSLLKTLLVCGSNDNDIVLDFFAGSGTTGHAVNMQNVLDNSRRRYVLIQLQEPLNPNNKDQKIAVDCCTKLGKPLNISELTKERLRRAGKKIQEEHPLFKGDLGFRVFKLDSSNIHEWEPKPANIGEAVQMSIEHLKADRSESDILYELLLKLGLDLAVPIEQKAIAGKTVYCIGAGTLFACLANSISTKEVESLAHGIIEWHKKLAPAGDTQVVFRDNAFADDVAKTNLTAILEQYGLSNVRSI